MKQYIFLFFLILSYSTAEFGINITFENTAAYRAEIEMEVCAYASYNKNGFDTLLECKRQSISIPAYTPVTFYSSTSTKVELLRAVVIKDDQRIDIDFAQYKELEPLASTGGLVNNITTSIIPWSKNGYRLVRLIQ